MEIIDRQKLKKLSSDEIILMTRPANNFEVENQNKYKETLNRWNDPFDKWMTWV